MLEHPAGRSLPKARAIRLARLRRIVVAAKVFSCLLMACSVALLLGYSETAGAAAFVATFFIMTAVTEVESVIRRLEWRQARDFWRLSVN
ncbi:hypothetical protein ACIBG8_54500 [Nonomuraea sp. NPDC050556]|uniref:hypothetical protein n=1 Tax=Nonomuraea sp. NPDC050556 TaxID=3364369 RepID=UPI0037AFE958